VTEDEDRLRAIAGFIDHEEQRLASLREERAEVCARLRDAGLPMTRIARLARKRSRSEQ
jgi:hypothetical protein